MTITLSERWMQLIEGALRRLLVGAARISRPSYSLRPQIRYVQATGGWCAEYGEVLACGETPEAAFTEFDRIWTGDDAQNLEKRR